MRKMKKRDEKELLILMSNKHQSSELSVSQVRLSCFQQAHYSCSSRHRSVDRSSSNTLPVAVRSTAATSPDSNTTKSVAIR